MRVLNSIPAYIPMGIVSWRVRQEEELKVSRQLVDVEDMAHVLKTAEARFLRITPSMMLEPVAATDCRYCTEGIFVLGGEEWGFVTVKEVTKIARSYGEKKQVEVFEIPRGGTKEDVCGVSVV